MVSVEKGSGARKTDSMGSLSSPSPREWSVAELGAFFVENRSEFLSHARRLTRTSSEAEELVQDSLVRVLLACPELQSANHALAYFHRVIENLSIDVHRRECRQPRLVVLDEATAEAEARWNANPELSDAVCAADDAAIIREAISLLSPAERAALIMWEIEGRSTAEIALELGIKESSVRHTLSRARAGLRRILSERIMDERRGLTALDLLSITYRKAEHVAKKSSKVALSLVLVLTAFLGFSSLLPNDAPKNLPLTSAELSVAENSEPLTRVIEKPLGQMSSSSVNGLDSSSATDSDSKSLSRSFTANALESGFAGLDAEGSPLGFTVADSLGNLGVLFPGQQRVSTTETGLLLSGIVSTKSGATNVLLDQSVVVDDFGTSYLAEVSVGINGGWRPLRLSFTSSDVERLASGNYLLTAVMVVDSAIETAVKVSTGTSGTDLSSAPEYVSTRVMLDPTKTKILAQAVLVSADSQEDGA